MWISWSVVCLEACKKKPQTKNFLIIVLKPAFSGEIMVAFFFLVSGSNYQHLRCQERTLSVKTWKLHLLEKVAAHCWYFPQLWKAGRAITSVSVDTNGDLRVLMSQEIISHYALSVKVRPSTLCMVVSFDGTVLPVSPRPMNWVDFDTHIALVIMTDKLT